MSMTFTVKIDNESQEQDLRVRAEAAKFTSADMIAGAIHLGLGVSAQVEEVEE